MGQCGLTMQDCGGTQVPEVGYLFCKEHWRRGLATEAAIACKRYAFDVPGADEASSIIRENNLPSQRVAGRSGMTVCGRFVKHYYGQEMPHLVFWVRREG